MSDKLKDKKYKRFVEDVIESYTEWKTNDKLDLETACKNNKLKVQFKLSYKTEKCTYYYELDFRHINPFPEDFKECDIIFKEYGYDFISVFNVEPPLSITLDKVMEICNKDD